MKRRFFGGDTLIEVMFAIGLFSVIVVGTISIMSGGTSKVQNSLEITMTRNEIDAEAEALRYIQSSYIAERDLSDGAQTYRKLWNDIKDLAINKNSASISAGQLEDILDYNPTTCKELYDSNGEVTKYGFVINHRMLDNVSINSYNSNSNNGVISIAKKNSGIFRTTQIYPRLLYSDSDNMYSNVGGSTKLIAAEGLYVITVKDTGTTSSVQEGSSTTSKAAAFYDFYIRSCWEGPNSKAPTLTSTVVRLYDPDIGVVDYKATTYVVEYNDNYGTWPSGRPATVAVDSFDKNYTIYLTNQKPSRSGYDFLGFQVDNPNYPGNKKLLNPGDKLTLTADHPSVTIYPVWGHLVSFTAKVDSDRFGTLSAESNYIGKSTGASVTIRIPENDNVVVNVETVNKGFVFSDWYRGDSFENNQKKYQLKVPSAITLTAKFAQDVTAIEKIRVLNVYPYSGSNLKSWMESNGYGKVNGKQVIQVTSVNIGTFNSKPSNYPVDSYDVVVFGFWDSNNGYDINSSAVSWLKTWTNQGKPAIFGHDTLRSSFSGFKQFAGYAGLSVARNEGIWSNIGNTDSVVTIVKDSTFTQYPWNIGSAGKQLGIPSSHDLAQQVLNTDNIFLKFRNQSAAATTADNFYLVVNGTGAMIQTGHSSGAATVDEQKILANLIFYLYSQYVIH